MREISCNLQLFNISDSVAGNCCCFHAVSEWDVAFILLHILSNSELKLDVRLI